VYLPLSDAFLSHPFDRTAALDAPLLDRFRTHVSEPLRPAFEEGVRQLRDGSFAEAEASFKKVMNPEGDSTAALVYLAATYAASGHDLQATSAWQTSLVDGSDIPQIFEWLAGAALRVRDMAQARATLEEAIAKWPGDARFARPMSMVYAGFGQGPEAIRSLERHLAEHPDDLEMLFAGVEWIYQLRLAGATAHSPAADVQLARNYADRYITAGGPQVALVRQWMTYLQTRR
jgi:tetratricopeptide (TPR) repeat protein